MSEKQVSLGDLFNDEQIEQAKELFLTSRPGTFNKLVVEAVVNDAMPHINEVTKQENDPRYMGYMLEHAFSQMGLQPGSKTSDPPSPGRRH